MRRLRVILGMKGFFGYSLMGRLGLVCSLAFSLAVTGLAQVISVEEEIGGNGEDQIPFTQELENSDPEISSEAFELRASAQRALEVGLNDLAYSFALRAGERLGGEVADLEVAFLMVDASLAESQWIRASELLNRIEQSGRADGSRVSLRRGMIAYAGEDLSAVESSLQSVDTDRLSATERVWELFLAAWVAAENGEETANRFAAARQAARAVSPALFAQINYLVFRYQLQLGVAGAETIPQLQNALLENAGSEIRFQFAQQLAALMHDEGRTGEAVALIDRSLSVVPAELPRVRAQFQLLATMAAGLRRAEGRQRFGELIFANRFPDLMSVALQQAFSEARFEDEESAPILMEVLDQVIAMSPEHSLLDQAYYYRAVFRFLGGDHLGAEEDAARLQERFPTSPYRRGMLALQASSAWNRNRYRTAASYLQGMREEFSDLSSDYRLAALIADCYFRAGRQSSTRDDYRNAAEAYAAALSASVDPSQSGALFFQLVLARLRAGQLDLALDAIDDPRLRRLAGGEMLWRAEWMALKEMRRVRRVSEAYDRVQFLLEDEIDDEGLRLRLLWLAARLSVVSGEPEDAQDWVNEVEQVADSGALLAMDETLLTWVRASSVLSLAESKFALGEAEEAVALLERLRKDYAGYEPALFSYIAQARYLSSINRTVEAQQLLVSLADEYRENRLAPIALFEAALNAERRGQDTYLDEAAKLLERIAREYPESEIVYRARLMQADLLRRLNKFDAAQYIYEVLEREYEDRPDRFLAQISLADTLIAQAQEDPRKFDAAVSRLELLMDLPQNLPEVPSELRIEAGYKLGEAWRTRGETLKAKEIYWSLYEKEVLEEEGGRRLSRNGRYWLTRCMFAMAELAKEDGQIDEARRLYEQVVQLRLPGSELAKRRLRGLVAPIEN